MIKTAAKKFYVFLIFLFLYAPIVTLIVLSFNASRTRAKWGGFTTRWYVSLFRNDAIMNALLNTLTIALIASLTATVIGTIACIAIINMKKKSRAIWMGITNIPMLNADIVTGISLMLLFLSLGLKFGYGTILLSHITFCIPYVILSVMPRMKQFNTSTYEAALDLGAGPVYSFFKVVLPGSIPTLLSTTKVNIGLSLVGVIIGEFLAARRGLGYLIIYGSQVFQLDMVISSILLLCVIAMLLYLLTQSLEHYSKKHRN